MISEVTNEDCMIMMARYPDRFFDLAIVDPPYGIQMSKRETIGGRVNGLVIQKNGFKSTTKRTEYKTGDWDMHRPEEKYFVELFRTSKNQIIFGGNYFSDLLPASSCWIVWHKDNTGNFSDCELAWSSFLLGIRLIKIRWNGMIQHDMANKEKRIHATQKPIKLYQWLLKNYANPGDKILDTHLGSGSSRIAAYKLGFDFWATELDADYYEAQEKRFKQAINEPLFQTAPDPEQTKLFP